MTTTERKRQRSPHQPTGTWIRPRKRLAIYLRDRFTCGYCGADLAGRRPADVTLDHLLPRCAGGTNDAANLTTACRPCNSARQETPWADYATGGARERIEHRRRQPLNLALADAILAGRAGDAEAESAR
jgi:5-methylcytosine-specific restriction endonuclease McrA